jgi:hypothetical protein
MKKRKMLNVATLVVALCVVMGLVPIHAEAQAPKWPDPAEYDIIDVRDQVKAACPQMKVYGYATKYPKGIVLHHTAGGGWKDSVEYRCGTGWKFSPYNLVVENDGRVYLLTTPYMKAWHAGSYNDSHIGISVEGNYNSKKLTPEVWKGIVTAIKYALDLGVPPSIIGHRDVPGMDTDCPGDKLYPEMENLLQEALGSHLALPEMSSGTIQTVDPDGVMGIFTRLVRTALLGGASYEYKVLPQTTYGLSKVWDLEQGRYLPEVGSIYQCPSGAMKTVKASGAKRGSVNKWSVHGNTHYHLDGTESWFGTDTHAACENKTIVAPMDGKMICRDSGDPEVDGGKRCDISGTGLYKGLYISILHFASYEGSGTVRRGEEIGKESSHSHVTVLWGDGTRAVGNRDVPYTALLPGFVKVVEGGAGSHYYAASPANSYFDGWMKVMPSAPSSQATKKYNFAASAQGGTDCAFNVKNFFAWKSGVKVGQDFSGKWEIPANAQGESLNRYFGPYTASQRMRDVGGPGGCACNAASMVRYVLAEAGLKAKLSLRSQQGHIIKGVQYKVPGVPEKYWTTIYSSGQDIKFTNPYDYPVYLHWSVSGDQVKLWVEGPTVSQEVEAVETTGTIPKFDLQYILGSATTGQIVLAVAIVLLVIAMLLFGLGSTLRGGWFIVKYSVLIPLKIITMPLSWIRRAGRRFKGPIWKGILIGVETVFWSLLLGTLARILLVVLYLVPGMVVQPAPEAHAFEEGVKYAVVFGSPCRSIGTLGRVCSPEGIIKEAKEWQNLVAQQSGTKTVFVAVPRIAGRFNISDARDLVQEVRANHPDGIVLPEVGGNYSQAYKVIDQLVDAGLDGIAVDLEFRSVTTYEELRRLGRYLAEKRREAGLSGDGILFVWHVFDYKIRTDTQGINIPGIRFVVVHDGYGSKAAKIGAYQRMREVYGLGPESTGWMAFDRRWGVNSACGSKNTTVGFDCQSWKSLVDSPIMQEAAWWSQQ